MVSCTPALCTGECKYFEVLCSTEYHYLKMDNIFIDSVGKKHRINQLRLNQTRGARLCLVKSNSGCEVTHRPSALHCVMRKGAPLIQTKLCNSSMSCKVIMLPDRYSTSGSRNIGRVRWCNISKRHSETSSAQIGNRYPCEGYKR